MSAIITDQFRILNANNFVESVENTNNSYYVFIGLPNPVGTDTLVGYGRSSEWNSNTPHQQIVFLIVLMQVIPQCLVKKFHPLILEEL